MPSIENEKFVHGLIIVTKDNGYMSRIQDFAWPEVGWSDNDIDTLRKALQSLFRDHVADDDRNGLYTVFHDAYSSRLQKGIEWRHAMHGLYQKGDIHIYLATHALQTAHV